MTSFIKGFTAPLRSLRFIFITPKILVLILIPLGINILLYILFFYYGSQYIHEKIFLWNEKILSNLPSWFSYFSVFIHVSLKLLAWITLTLIAAFSFTFVSGIIFSPFNDLLSKQTEAQLQKKSHKERVTALHLSIRKTVTLELKRTVVLGIGGIISIILGLIPLMQLPALLLGSLLISFEYFGYPVSHHSSRLSSVWFFTLRHLCMSCGFGFFMLVLIALPFASILYIPLAVVAATLLHYEIRIK